MAGMVSENAINHTGFVFLQNQVYYGMDDRIWKFDILDKKRMVLTGYNQRLQNFAISPDGKSIIYITWKGLGLQHIGKSDTDFSDEVIEPTVVAWSPNGEIIAISTRNGEIMLFDARNHTEIKLLRGHTLEVTDLEFSPDGKLLGSVSMDGSVQIWGIHP